MCEGADRAWFMSTVRRPMARFASLVVRESILDPRHPILVVVQHDHDRPLPVKVDPDVRSQSSLLVPKNSC
jgi:hypothetical protein